MQSSDDRQKDRVEQFYRSVRRACCTKKELIAFSEQHWTHRGKPTRGGLLWIRREPHKPFTVLRDGYYRLPLEYFGILSRYPARDKAFLNEHRLNLDTLPKFEEGFEDGGKHFSEDELQRMLAKNPSLLESGLTVVDRKVKTGFGEIDLLCKDANGGYVVLELKRDRAIFRVVVAQTLVYVGWVKHNLAKGRRVRAFVIGGFITEEMRCAGYALPALQFRTWKDLFQRN